MRMFLFRWLSRLEVRYVHTDAERAAVKAFLQDWMLWIESGAPDGHLFLRCNGLCRAFHKWITLHSVDVDVASTRKLLVSMFQADGLDGGYPFNKGRFKEFCRETNQSETHLNEKRLAWARKHSK